MSQLAVVCKTLAGGASEGRPRELGSQSVELRGGGVDVRVSQREPERTTVTILGRPAC